MKKILIFLPWTLALVVIGYVLIFHAIPIGAKLATQTRCTVTDTYRIGTVDARFNMTADEFKAFAQKGADAWNNQLGIQRFTYDPEGKIQVSLVYDERQSLSSEIDNLENKVNSEKNQIEPEIERYEQLVENYDKRVDELNSEIQYWNGQGGAPPEVFDRIISEQKSLKEDADQLNELARRLNQSTNQFNQDVGQLNRTVDSFNDTLDVKPEQGLYNSGENSIEIYFSNDENELIHTLTHEFGHALGIDGHVDDEAAIMYRFNSDTTNLTNDDIDALNQVCEKNILSERLTTNIQYIMVRLGLRENNGEFVLPAN